MFSKACKFTRRSIQLVKPMAEIDNKPADANVGLACRFQSPSYSPLKVVQYAYNCSEARPAGTTVPVGAIKDPVSHGTGGSSASALPSTVQLDMKNTTASLDFQQLTAVFLDPKLN